jgi:hypothetical protein
MESKEPQLSIVSRAIPFLNALADGDVNTTNLVDAMNEEFYKAGYPYRINVYTNGEKYDHRMVVV